MIGTLLGMVIISLCVISKEAKTVFIPYCGYVVTPSDELLKARIRRNLCKESKEFYKKVRSYYETTMQGVPI